MPTVFVVAIDTPDPAACGFPKADFHIRFKFRTDWIAVKPCLIVPSLDKPGLVLVMPLVAAVHKPSQVVGLLPYNSIGLLPDLTKDRRIILMPHFIGFILRHILQSREFPHPDAA